MINAISAATLVKVSNETVTIQIPTRLLFFGAGVLFILFILKLSTEIYHGLPQKFTETREIPSLKITNSKEKKTCHEKGLYKLV